MSVYPQLFAALDQAVFVRCEDSRFELATAVPDWLPELLPDVDFTASIDLVKELPYLELLVADAEGIWAGEQPGRLRCEDWLEGIDAVNNVALSASAVLLEGKAMLVIESLGERYHETQRVYQAARDTLLTRDQLEKEVARRTAQIRQREEEISIRLLSATNMRDQETGAHVRRIGLYAAAVAEALGWGVQAVEDILVAAPMHDIGKIGIPDSILNKPGKLTESEFHIMKQHARIGYEMLAGTDIDLLNMAGEIALNHHERWDGQGYPAGICGEAIPLSARIVSVCDVYDALRHQRVYKPAFSEQETVELMQEQSGHHFDPAVLGCFMNILVTIQQIRETVSEADDEVLDFYQLTGTFG